MSLQINSLHRIAKLKRDLMQLHDTRDSRNELFCYIPSPVGDIRLSFTLTADLQTVRCITGTGDPLDETLVHFAQDVIRLNNDWRSIPLDRDPNGRLYTYVICTYSHFILASEALIDLTMVRPATDAVFNAMSLMRDLADAEEPIGPGRATAPDPNVN